MSTSLAIRATSCHQAFGELQILRRVDVEERIDRPDGEFDIGVRKRSDEVLHLAVAFTYQHAFGGAYDRRAPDRKHRMMSTAARRNRDEGFLGFSFRTKPLHHVQRIKWTVA